METDSVAQGDLYDSVDNAVQTVLCLKGVCWGVVKVMKLRSKPTSFSSGQLASYFIENYTQTDDTSVRQLSFISHSQHGRR